MTKSMVIRSLVSQDSEALTALISLAFGGPEVVRLGMLTNAAALPGFGAFCGQEMVGELTYLIGGDACELVTLNVKEQRSGIGSSLMKAFQAFVRAEGFQRIFLVTTNDNLDALRFYQQRGWQMVAVHAGAVHDVSRKLKPQIPLTGAHGIPIRDEIVLELSVAD